MSLMMIDNGASAGVGVIPGRKLLSVVKLQQHSSSLSPEILMLVLNYLDKEELLNCKLVCRDWGRWIALTEPMSSASTVFSIPHIVENIFEKLNHKERLESRLISESFNLVAAKYLHLAPILTDITSKSILSIGSNLHVEEIKTSSLYINLPTMTTTDGILLVDCAFDRSKVKSLTFYEGVIRSNKQVLLQSFPHIEHLKYMSSTNFLLYENVKYTFLKKLEITTSLYDENGSLRSFFSNAKFPALEILELSIQARLDFLLYLEVHYFITVHLERLKKLVLIFGTDFIFAGLEVAKIFRNLPTHLNERWLQVLNVIENNTNSIDCRLKFLRCEGISKFRLSISLYDNLKSLNPDALILYDTPEDDNMDLEDEDEEDDGDGGDDDDDVEDVDFENQDGEGAFQEENNPPVVDFIFDADFMGFNEGEDNTNTDTDSDNEGNDDDDDVHGSEIEVYGLQEQGNINVVDIDNFLNAWEHEPDSQGEDYDDDDEDDELNLVLEAFDEDAYVNEDDDDDDEGQEVQGLELELEILPPLPLPQCYEQEDSPDDDDDMEA